MTAARARPSRKAWLVPWIAENHGLCRICNAAAPTADPLDCPTGCDLEAAYQRGGYAPLGARPAEEVFSDDETSQPTQAKRRLELTCAQDVTPEDVEWIWEGWLPRRKLGAFDGAPGIGKTTLFLDLLARATRGDRMPGADLRTPPQTVLIAGVEDGWADTIRPRLDAANANLARVHFVTVANSGTFTVPNDVELLAEAVRETGAGWVHIDAIMGTLADEVRTNSDHDVRRALGSLKDMADRENVLVTFIRHPRKAGAASAIDAGGGSTAFSAVARVVLFAGFDPSDTTEDLNARRRVLALAKSNLGRIPPSRCFQLVGAPNGRPRIAWGDVTPITADELASAPMRQRFPSGANGEPSTKKAAAESWLEGMLAGGARVTVDALKGAARQCKLSWRTIERASQDLGVSKPRGRVGECSTWYLPPVPPVVAPTRPASEQDGATEIYQNTLDLPVAPSVAPSGGSGATEEMGTINASAVPSRQAHAYVEKIGGSGATDDSRREVA